MPPLEPGIHLLHKPAGPTSFSLVQPFLSEARGRRPRIAVCHGGALDPFAEGLLPILVGRATRAFELLHPIPKEYQAEVSWGAETDNGDPLGVVVAPQDTSAWYSFGIGCSSSKARVARPTRMGRSPSAKGPRPPPWRTAILGLRPR